MEMWGSLSIQNERISVFYHSYLLHGSKQLSSFWNALRLAQHEKGLEVMLRLQSFFTSVTWDMIILIMGYAGRAGIRGSRDEPAAAVNRPV